MIWNGIRLPHRMSSVSTAGGPEAGLGSSGFRPFTVLMRISYFVTPEAIPAIETFDFARVSHVAERASNQVHDERRTVVPGDAEIVTQRIEPLDP